MKLTNEQIYNYSNFYTQEFADFKSYIPAKVNFAIQKNMQVLAAAAQGIEETRMEVAKHYGVMNEDGQSYQIPEDARPQAQQELNDLFSIEQELEIKTFSIDALGDVEFTPAQMQAIMFMIED